MTDAGAVCCGAQGGSGATASGIVAAEPSFATLPIPGPVDDVAIDADGPLLDVAETQYGLAAGGPRQADGQASGCGDDCVTGLSLQKQPAANTAGHNQRRILWDIVIRDRSQIHCRERPTADSTIRKL